MYNEAVRLVNTTVMPQRKKRVCNCNTNNDIYACCGINLLQQAKLI